MSSVSSASSGLVVLAVSASRTLHLAIANADAVPNFVCKGEHPDRQALRP